MPFFSIVAMSASMHAAALALVDEGGELRVACAAARARADARRATAQKVTPMIVSARVVKTYMRPSPIRLPRGVA